MTVQQLERRVRRLTTYATLLTLGAVSLALTAASPAGTAWVGRVVADTIEADTLRTHVLEVERINVIEADGRLAVVVSNGERIPGPIFEGEEFPPEISDGRRGSAGLVFYNADETEAGGLIHRTTRSDSTYSAVGMLTFDQFDQDQTASLRYLDDGESRSAGLEVWDRPTAFSIEDVIDLVMGMQSEDAARRAESEAAYRTAIQSGELYGPTRVFVGSEDRTAEVRLQDTSGRPRIRLSVDSLDVARLEFLDAAGDVVLRLPEE